MSHDTAESGQKRNIAVLVSLSPEELAALERLMVAKGFRMRATATRWAMLVLAGAHELAARSVPRIAQRRALDRSPLRVVRGDERPPPPGRRRREPTIDDGDYSEPGK